LKKERQAVCYVASGGMLSNELDRIQKKHGLSEVCSDLVLTCKAQSAATKQMSLDAILPLLVFPVINFVCQGASGYIGRTQAE
jgi:hypothetical protein